MKKLLLALVVLVLLMSCTSTYHYVQVCKATCSNRAENLQNADEEVVYEDDNVVVFYNFWQENGNAGFGVYNKTSKIVYVDLSKSFFVRNGVSYPYYKGRSWSQSNSSTTQTTTGYQSSTSNQYYKTNSNGYSYVSVNTNYHPNYIYSTLEGQGTKNGSLSAYSYTTKSSTITTNTYNRKSEESKTELPIMPIAPHASSWVSEYDIFSYPFVDCDLERFPEESANMYFSSAEESPLSFSNIITYNMGEGSLDSTITNNFYISNITNYARPTLVKYVLRETKPCQNVTNSTESNYKTKYDIKIYDDELTINPINCYFTKYKVSTSKKLYKSQLYLVYDSYYDGYVLPSGNNSFRTINQK